MKYKTTFIFLGVVILALAIIFAINYNNTSGLFTLRPLKIDANKLDVTSEIKRTSLPDANTKAIIRTPLLPRSNIDLNYKFIHENATYRFLDLNTLLAANCALAISELKTKNEHGAYPVLCKEFSDNKLSVAYYLETNHGLLTGCFNFEDSCDLNKVVNLYCNDELNYDIFEGRFYSKVKETFYDMSNNFDLTEEESQKLMQDYNITAEQLLEYLQQISNKGASDPRNTFILLGEKKIKELAKEIIDEKVIIEEIKDCLPNQYCSLGKCVNYKNIDLYVGYISSKAYGNNCNNTIEFEVCNAGQETINNPFLITVETNNKEITYEYDPNKKGTIPSNKCTKTTDLSLNILNFGLNLNQDTNTKIILNSNNSLYESNYENNTKYGIINTLEEYYDNDKICKEWCYNSDATELFKGVFKQGIITYTWHSIIFSDNDFCDKDNDLFIYEHKCGQTDFGNAYTEYLDCRFYGAKNGGKTGICLNDKCVPIDTPDLTICIDSESGRDLYSKGTIEYRPMSGGNTETLIDKCENDNELTEYSCEMGDKVNIPYLETSKYNCELGCFDGSCIPEISSTCSDSDSGDDIYTPGNATITKTYIDPITNLTATKETSHNDYCLDNGDQIQEITCENNELNYIKHENLFEQGIGCVELEEDDYAAKVIELSEEKKNCTDSETGINLEYEGYVDYTDALGQNHSRWDSCVIEEETKIIDYYCEDKEIQFTVLDCEQGFACGSGKCKKKVQEQSCIEEENKVIFTDIFGDTIIRHNYCQIDNTLRKPYCQDNKIEYNYETCDSGFACNGSTNKCEKIMSDFKCEEITNYQNSNVNGVKITDIFGNESFNLDYCQGDYLLSKKQCLNNEVVDVEINCLDNEMGCKKYSSSFDNYLWYHNGYCAPGDLSKIKCELKYDPITGLQNEIAYTNIFGETTYRHDSCSGDDGLFKTGCNGNLPKSDKIPCDSGMLCDYVSDSCKLPVTEHKCEEFNDLFSGRYVKITDIFGNIYNMTDNCYSSFENKIITSSCSIYGTSENEIECPNNFGCANTIIDIDGESYTTAKCVPSNPELIACSDYDNDKNIFAQSEVLSTNQYGTKKTERDYCLSETKISESFCENKLLDRAEIECPTNYICMPELPFMFNDELRVGAACKLDIGELKITSCEDSDNGKEILIPGMTKIQSNYGHIDLGFDYCIGNTQLSETFCENNDRERETIACPQGYVCKTQEYSLPEYNFTHKAAYCVQE